MDIEIMELINEIKLSNPSVIYSSFRNLFNHLNKPFCKYNLKYNLLVQERKRLYRVRSHLEGNGIYFFKNINELSFRQDVTKIKKYGRCNEPFQSCFYASDDNSIAFSEVSEIVRTENKKNIAYHTTSVWKFNQDVLVAPIFEHDTHSIVNAQMLEITQNCIESINDLPKFNQNDKDELNKFLRYISKEFIKPSSLDDNAYLLSSAYSNYVFNSVGIQNEKVDGILYPTCLEKITTRNFGLNYCFKNSIIGFNKKIEFIEAYRSQLIKQNNQYYEVERIYNKSIDINTGCIYW